jgi:hypothetical protein
MPPVLQDGAAVAAQLFQGDEQQHVRAFATLFTQLALVEGIGAQLAQSVGLVGRIAPANPTSFFA